MADLDITMSVDEYTKAFENLGNQLTNLDGLKAQLQTSVNDLKSHVQGSYVENLLKKCDENFQAIDRAKTKVKGAQDKIQNVLQSMESTSSSLESEAGAISFNDLFT